MTTMRTSKKFLELFDAHKTFKIHSNITVAMQCIEKFTKSANMMILFVREKILNKKA